jgi:hypothetical protein
MHYWWTMMEGLVLDLLVDCLVDGHTFKGFFGRREGCCQNPFMLWCILDLSWSGVTFYNL